MPRRMGNLSERTGSSGIFIRTLLTKLESGEAPLRTAIEEAIKAVDDEGGQCGLIYAKRLRTDLAQAGIVRTRKKGKAWVIGLTDAGVAEWKAARELNWGYELEITKTQVTTEELQQRTKDLDRLETTIVKLVAGENKFQRMKAFEQWREGKLKMYVVPADSVVKRTAGNPNRFVIITPESE